MPSTYMESLATDGAGPYLDLIHISNPRPGLSKSLLERLDIGQVNRYIFCFMDYGLKCGWWMLLPKKTKQNNTTKKGGGAGQFGLRIRAQPDQQLYTAMHLSFLLPLLCLYVGKDGCQALFSSDCMHPYILHHSSWTYVCHSVSLLEVHILTTCVSYDTPCV